MSWWIYLEDEKGKTVKVKNHSEGGTYVLGGTTRAELNVTYNYSKWFDFKKLNGSIAENVIKLFEKTIKDLGTEREKDYWNPTKGNVGYALSILLKWAKKYPKAVFRVS